MPGRGVGAAPIARRLKRWQRGGGGVSRAAGGAQVGDLCIKNPQSHNTEHHWAQQRSKLHIIITHEFSFPARVILR